MNRYPAKPMMDQMARHGRYGDTMLVHMNPIEVAGIASLVPGGKLTTNPVTGQPEAFLPLLFGALGGALKLGTLGTAALSGIGTAAVTGDIKRGLLAGLTSGLTAGIGEAFTGADAAADVATTGSDLATSAPVGIEQALAENVAQDGLAGLTDYTGQAASMSQQISDAGAYAPVDYMAKTQGIADTTAQAIAPPPPPSTVSQQLFGGAETAVNKGIGALGTSGQLVGAMTAEGMSQQMQTQQDFERQQAAVREKSEAKRRQAYDDLQGAYALAQPSAQRGYSPYRSMMSRNTPPPMYSAQGGVVRMNEGGVTPTDEEARVLALAGQGILGSEDQMILEGFYNNLNAANTAASQAEAETEATDNTLFIPEGATNQEALQALKGAGLVDQPAYNWFQKWFSESSDRGHDAANSQYLASESFPGMEEWMTSTGFADSSKEYIRSVVPLIQQGATTGIPLNSSDPNVTNVTGLLSGSPFGSYSGGANMGYQGLDPVQVQANLRGNQAVNAPRDFMTGFEPEFSYFQADASRPITPDRSFRPTSQRITSTGEYFDPIIDRADYLEQIKEYYSTLGNYTPASVEYPEVKDPVDDDPDTTTSPGTTPPVATPTDGVTAEQVQALYQQLLNRDGADEYVMQWVNSGMTLAEIEEQIKLSAEYLSNQGTTSGSTGSGTTGSGSTGSDTTGSGSTGSDTTGSGTTGSGATGSDTTGSGTTSSTSGFTPPTYTDEEIALYKYRTMTPQAFAASGYSLPTVAGVSVADIGGPSFPEGQAYQGQSTTARGGPVFDGTKATQPDYQAGQQGDTVGGIGNTTGMGQDINWSAPTTQTLSAGDVFETPAGDYRAVDNGYGQIGLVAEGDVAVGSEGDIIYNTTSGDHHFGVDPNTGEAWYQGSQGLTSGDTETTSGFAEGGSIPLRSSMGNTEVAAGGIANVPTEFSASMPTEQEFNMVAAAVLGRIDDPDAIVDMFVKRYGPEMFQQIRNMVLRSSQPQAQTEGMIRGNGSGMDDKVPGMIGDQQPVAVSPGEFIVPADVVSGLGDGSSDAGAKELDQMMERVRMARGGTTKQAPSIDASGVMPA